MRNWRKVNDNLVKRGSIFVNFSFLSRWEKEVKATNEVKIGKKGRKFSYPNCLFYLTGFLHSFMGFRQIEGVLLELSKLKEFMVPDYSTIFRRVIKLGAELEIPKIGDDFVVAIDSSGIKVTNRGDWIRKKHGKKHKGWLKLHIAVDTKSKRLVGLRITNERIGDNSEFKNLLKQALKVGKPSKLLADSAYDSRDNFNLLSRLGITPGIKPRSVDMLPKGWRPLWQRKRLRISARGSLIRKQNVIEYSLNPNTWKQRMGYGKRWVVEIFFSAFKRIFGEHVRARKFNNMVNELLIKATLYNRFISL